MPTDERFLEVFNLLERVVEDRWGIPVRIKDVPNPFTGDLDGAEIQIDYDLTPEDGLFILVHLFGHTVQWNVSPETREFANVRGSLDPDTTARLIAYEKQACRYSLQLMHEAGVHDLDQWLADFSHCDLSYLLDFYQTGAKHPFRSFWKDGQALMTALPIPPFEPTQWRSRWDGVVV
jgi:hypothetical protein